ncbi:MAG: hypothetical protein P4M09_07460 [Devosia sp.]|nr:hypothetical protein [Devosia sp.]
MRSIEKVCALASLICLLGFFSAPARAEDAARATSDLPSVRVDPWSAVETIKPSWWLPKSLPKSGQSANALAGFYGGNTPLSYYCPTTNPEKLAPFTWRNFIGPIEAPPDAPTLGSDTTPSPSAVPTPGVLPWNTFTPENWDSRLGAFYAKGSEAYAWSNDFEAFAGKWAPNAYTDIFNNGVSGDGSWSRGVYWPTTTALTTGPASAPLASPPIKVDSEHLGLLNRFAGPVWFRISTAANKVVYPKENLGPDEIRTFDAAGNDALVMTVNVNERMHPYALKPGQLYTIEKGNGDLLVVPYG